MLCTPPSLSIWSVRTCSLRARARLVAWPLQIGRTPGVRHIVITDVNPYRLDLARKMGATLALDVRTEKLADAMTQLGMKEGFDVCLEMSGNPKAFADILPNVFYGGKIALLGIIPSTAPIYWNVVGFHSL